MEGQVERSQLFFCYFRIDVVIEARDVIGLLATDSLKLSHVTGHLDWSSLFSYSKEESVVSNTYNSKLCFFLSQDDFDIHIQGVSSFSELDDILLRHFTKSLHEIRVV